MIFRKLRWLNKEPVGFTLVEVLVTLLITSLIGLGASMATVQVFTQGNKNSDYTTASRHTMNAIHWISRDAQMAQDVETNGATGFPLVLSWTDWDNSQHEVTYSIVGDELKRSYSVNGTGTKETVVAQYINSTSENTTCQPLPGRKSFTLKVTTTVGENAQVISVSKEQEITPRPSL